MADAAVSLDPRSNDFAEAFAREHQMSKDDVVALALRRLQEASERDRELCANVAASYAGHRLSDEDRAWLELGSQTARDALKDDEW